MLEDVDDVIHTRIELIYQLDESIELFGDCIDRVGRWWGRRVGRVGRGTQVDGMGCDIAKGMSMVAATKFGCTRERTGGRDSVAYRTTITTII